ncbi:MAG: CPBP family intramembrane metalloprotease [Planctomycetia bacterium]|nr:CPBP family intramembrane metalloprotease [Planctomycetia bacterium]
MRANWAILLLAMIGPTVAAQVYFVMLASTGQSPAEANAALQISYFGSKAVQFALPVVWLGWWQGQRLRPTKPNFDGLALGLGFGLLVVAAMLGLYFGELRDSPLLAGTPARLRLKVAEYGMATPFRFILMGAFISFIHSLLEEYYWRWFVFGELRKLMPVTFAIVVSSFAFMGHHVVVLAVYFPEKFWTAAVPFSLAVAIGGMVWAWLYHRTGSIWSAWLSHLVIDVGIMILGYDLLFCR